MKMEARRGRFLSHSLSTPLLHLYPKPLLHSPKELKMILVAEKLPLIGDISLSLLVAMVFPCEKFPSAAAWYNGRLRRASPRGTVSLHETHLFSHFFAVGKVSSCLVAVPHLVLGKIFGMKFPFFPKDRPFQKKGKEPEGKKSGAWGISLQRRWVTNLDRLSFRTGRQRN